MKPVRPVQMTTYQINTYRKDLGWLHFNNELMVQERNQVKDQKSSISIIVAYPNFQVATRSTSSYMTTVYHTWLYRIFMEIQKNLRRQKLPRTNQGSTFFGGSFSNWDNVRAPIQFKSKSQPQQLQKISKKIIFPWDKLINFHINSTSVIRTVKPNKLSFSSIETGYFCEDFPSKTIQSRLLLKKEETRPNNWPEIP